MVNLRQFGAPALGTVVAVPSVLGWFQHGQLESWKAREGKVTENMEAGTGGIGGVSQCSGRG